METHTKDDAVMAHIKALTEKEEQLYGKDHRTDEDIQELHKINSQLDQYWDLLHQRRALRDAGKNPAKASLRSIDTIQHYQG